MAEYNSGVRIPTNTTESSPFAFSGLGKILSKIFSLYGDKGEQQHQALKQEHGDNLETAFSNFFEKKETPDTAKRLQLDLESSQVNIAHDGLVANSKSENGRFSLLDAHNQIQIAMSDTSILREGLKIEIINNDGTSKNLSDYTEEDFYNLALLHESAKNESSLHIANKEEINAILKNAPQNILQEAQEDWNSLYKEQPNLKKAFDGTTTEKTFTKDDLNLVAGELAVKTGIVTQEQADEAAQRQADAIAITFTLESKKLAYKDEDGNLQLNIEELKKHKLYNEKTNKPDVFGLAFMPKDKREALKQELGVSNDAQLLADKIQRNMKGTFDRDLDLVAFVPGFATIIEKVAPADKIFGPQGIEIDKAKEDPYKDLVAVQNWNRAGDIIARLDTKGTTEDGLQNARKIIEQSNVLKFLAGDMSQDPEKQHDIMIKYQSLWVAASLHEMRAAHGNKTFTQKFIGTLPEETQKHLSKIFAGPDEALEPALLAKALNREASMKKLKKSILEDSTELSTLFTTERYKALPSFSHENFSQTIKDAGKHFEANFKADTPKRKAPAKKKKPTTKPKPTTPKAPEESQDKEESAEPKKPKKPRTGSGGKANGGSGRKRRTGGKTGKKAPAAPPKARDIDPNDIELQAEYYYLMGVTDNEKAWKLRQHFMGVSNGVEFVLYNALAEKGIYADRVNRTRLEDIKDLDFLAAYIKAKEKYEGDSSQTAKLFAKALTPNNL